MVILNWFVSLKIGSDGGFKHFCLAYFAQTGWFNHQLVVHCMGLCHLEWPQEASKEPSIESSASNLKLLIPRCAHENPVFNWSYGCNLSKPGPWWFNQSDLFWYGYGWPFIGVLVFPWPPSRGILKGHDGQITWFFVSLKLHPDYRSIFGTPFMRPGPQRLGGPGRSNARISWKMP